MIEFIIHEVYDVAFHEVQLAIKQLSKDKRSPKGRIQVTGSSEDKEEYNPKLKSYAESSELLKIHHLLQPSRVFKQQIEFHSATQTFTDSVNDWHERVMKRAASCDFGNQLDTVLEDNSVSGVANQRVVRKLCEVNISASPRDLVDMAEKYAPLYCTNTSLFDLPDEVLMQIILLLGARERVPLGNSCRRFKSLVFQDRKLLRYLNFSKKGGLTTMTQIQQYFNNENTCRHIVGINAENVACIKPGDPLNNSIGKALNLVEVNIQGTQFENIEQLGSFLKPLLHLEKLSMDWPTYAGTDISLCKPILQRPFSKLTYLSVRFRIATSTIFTSSLSLCQQLKELYMRTIYYSKIGICRNSWNSEIKQLTNLKIVQYIGGEAIRIKNELATVLPDPKRWTDFQECGHIDHQGFYIEKDVEVCEELMQSERLQDFMNTAPWEDFNLGWILDPKCLLKEVLRITHEDVPVDLCCLSTFEGGRRHLLKVEEAKLLLKDPRYQISYLYLDHRLERRCDAHLLASAFPNLTELLLFAVTPNEEKAPKDSYFQRRLSRRCSPVPEKQDDSPNLGSSFKMLVENTPHLKHFTLGELDGYERIEDWDLDALRLISSWQNLETLYLSDVSCGDGQLLIEIGKRCKNLKKLSLSYVFDKVALFEMLKHCRNLRDSTLWCDGIDEAEMFAALTKNVELERVQVTDGYTEHSAAPWISSLENLVGQCEKLNTIICYTRFKTEDDLNEAVTAVKRIKEECHRPDFQIKLTGSTGEQYLGHCVTIGTAIEDFPQNEPFPV